MREKKNAENITVYAKFSCANHNGKTAPRDCRSTRRSLWSGRTKTISTCFRVKLSITGYVSQRAFLCNIQGAWCSNQIRLIKSDQHYDGCTSFPAFVNRSYCCLKCEKGCNVEDVKHHLCRGTECRACGRKGLCPPSMLKGAINAFSSSTEKIAWLITLQVVNVKNTESVWSARRRSTLS